MLLIIKVNEVLIHAITYMILDNMLSEKSWTQKSHLYERYRISISIETGSKLVFSGEWGVTAWYVQGSLWGNENILELARNVLSANELYTLINLILCNVNFSKKMKKTYCQMLGHLIIILCLRNFIALSILMSFKTKYIFK